MSSPKAFYEMGLVEDHRSVAPLPEVAGGAGAGVDVAGVAAMQVGKGAAQTVFVGRHHHHMDVVGHQAISPHLGAGTPAAFGQQVEIKGVVALFEERLVATVAPLGDVMGQAGNDEAGKAGHAESWHQ
jgi:hypothetical protein